MDEKVVSIADLQEAREHKEAELAYYYAQLEEYEKRLAIINKEIHMTNILIDMIKKEKLADIALYMKMTKLIEPSD
jgi:uncharacterized protein (UPF0128 family)